MAQNITRSSSGSFMLSSVTFQRLSSSISLVGLEPWFAIMPHCLLVATSLDLESELRGVVDCGANTAPTEVVFSDVASVCTFCTL